MENNEEEKLYDQLSVMSHGIYKKSNNDLMITLTTEGLWIWLDKTFKKIKTLSFKNLDKKIHGIEDAEWIQQVVPFNDNIGLSIDANRGLIAFDLNKEEYCVYNPNENWCIQDVLFV